MAKSRNGFLFLTNIITWIVSIVFTIFLTSLSFMILDDLDRVFSRPLKDDYKKSQVYKDIIYNVNNQQEVIYSIETGIDQLERSRESANRTYLSEKELYENWLQARSTINSIKDDSEVRKRVKKLDELKLEVNNWDSLIEKNTILLNKQLEELGELELKKSNELDNINKIYNRDYKKYRILTLLLRMLFAMPILVISIILFIKKRKTKFKAQIWSFISFALITFFVGLVPYLNLFGEYVRITFGIILSALLGYYIVKQTNKYKEKLQKKLDESTSERAKSIKYDNALKSFNNHICPSCEKDFLIEKQSWLENTNRLPMFCPHCGLELFIKCKKCSTIHFKYFRNCSSCGDKF